MNRSGRPSPRIAREPVQHVRKPDTRTSRSHKNFIRSLPCCSCGKPPRSEQAHIRAGTDGGMSLRPSDRYSVPLCNACHLTGPGAQHSVGELAFWAERGVDPYGLAEHLWTNSGDLSAGTRAVLRMFMEIMQRKGRAEP